jgi:hypothetical protein
MGLSMAGVRIIRRAHAVHAIKRLYKENIPFQPVIWKKKYHLYERNCILGWRRILQWGVDY